MRKKKKGSEKSFKVRACECVWERENDKFLLLSESYVSAYILDCMHQFREFVLTFDSLSMVFKLLASLKQGNYIANKENTFYQFKSRRNNRIRVALDTELAEYPAGGYLAE